MRLSLKPTTSAVTLKSVLADLIVHNSPSPKLGPSASIISPETEAT